MNHRTRLLLANLLGLLLLAIAAPAQTPMDIAPFAQPLTNGVGMFWEDPREIHSVVLHFALKPPPTSHLKLQYWGSRWPQQHLPKDKQPGGGDVGWMELGNWYQGGWRVADTDVVQNGNTVKFTFRPVDAKEFPAVPNYPATFRYTLKIAVTSDLGLSKPDKIEVFTDSVLQDRAVRLVFNHETVPKVEVFNGLLKQVEKLSPTAYRLHLQVATNSDPNSYDRTLVTVHTDKTFTFGVDDLKDGALFVPSHNAAVLPEEDGRDYAGVAAEQHANPKKNLKERVAEMPEQTWQAATNGFPPKKSFIYFPLGLDGGRQRFALHPDGSILFRSNDEFLKRRPGADPPKLAAEAGPITISFGMPEKPVKRTIEEDSIPMCHTQWDLLGSHVEQVAFVAPLSGAITTGAVPPADTTAVFMARFTFSNTTATAQNIGLSLGYHGKTNVELHVDENGIIWAGEMFRGHLVGSDPHFGSGAMLLAPHATTTVTVKIPYLVLTDEAQRDALMKMDFDRERRETIGYWRRRLNESAQLVTPEPVLNQFYRAHAGHLLINCEREPNTALKRFARVGSFTYGAYGNESCMMVVDLDRRGMHKEAQECLNAWLAYQGTVGLPGDFTSKQGVLYGAGGYEAGGYNQHHGWILWCLAEHYRFTRDRMWLNSAAPGIVAGANWIIRETQRTTNRTDLSRGLLPAGSLEDIGDWWNWLSTSCYTWRGLDSAAWALEQLNHGDAKRIRKAADDYHAALLADFRAAMERSPVVRLRNGVAVPQFPSYVQRRGRSFGWICQTLEGPMHLMITHALDPKSEEASWILNDYEDNLFLSNQYGYTLDDFEKHWFGRGGMSMQACLLFTPEVYLDRDEIKNALRGIFNAIAVSHFPDVHMNTEHALPDMSDWRGDHYKTSDEANACGWLRQMFVREEGNDLQIGKAIPREWLAPGKRCGMERAATYFGPLSVIYSADKKSITAHLAAPKRNFAKAIHVRFRHPTEEPIQSVTVNGQAWKDFSEEWVNLPGVIGSANVTAIYAK